MSKPKFKAGQVVFLDTTGILARKVRVVSVVERGLLKPRYIVRLGADWFEPVSERVLYEVQA